MPIIQQASIDYINDPARTNAIILDAVAGFGEDFGWTYTEGHADYGVSTIKEDGLVANGPDGMVGNFDLDRVNGLIEIAVPIYTAQGAHAEGRRDGRRHRHQPVHRPEHRSLIDTTSYH